MSEEKLGTRSKRRISDGSVHARQCVTCGAKWKIYQKSTCSCEIGTCDLQEMGHYKIPHQYSRWTCVNWREQPAQGEPTRTSLTDWENLRPDGTRHREPRLETNQAEIDAKVKAMQQLTEAGPVEGMSAVANFAMSNDWADRAANLIFSRIHLGTEPEPNFTVRKITVKAWAELIRREWTATFGTGNIRPKPVSVEGMSAEQFRKQNSRPNMTTTDLMEAYALKVRETERDMQAHVDLYIKEAGELREERDALKRKLEGK